MANPKKRKGAIREQERNLHKLNEKNMCDCTHTKPKTGDLDIIPARDRQHGELKYVCNECEKDLYLDPIPEDDLRFACDVIDRACDTIKISLDLSKESEQKMRDNVSETQYRVRNEIIKMYGAALKSNNKSRGNGSRGRSGGNSSWAKPEVHR